jgi:hypothetical protein
MAPIPTSPSILGALAPFLLFALFVSFIVILMLLLEIPAFVARPGYFIADFLGLTRKQIDLVGEIYRDLHLHSGLSHGVLLRLYTIFKVSILSGQVARANTFKRTGPSDPYLNGSDRVCVSFTKSGE